MRGLTRRGFGIAAGATALLGNGALLEQAMAQTAAAEATRNLPRTYSGTTLRITWGSTPSYQLMADFSSRFTEATGIRLDFQFLQQTDRYQKMILDASSNTNSFDIYLTAYQWKEQIAPHAHNLMRLDQEVRGVPPMDWDDYPQRALEAYSRVDGKAVAIPLLGDVSMLVWDKTALRDAGLDPDSPPADWEGVHRNGVALNKGGRYGFNMPAGKSIQTACTWITLFHAFGGQYLDAAGRPTFGSDAALKTFTFMSQRLGKISPPGNLTWDFPEMINSLVSGQSAQGYMWAGGFSTLFDPSKSKIAGSLGWAPTPQAVLLGGWGIAVNAKSRSLDAARLFVGWLTSKEISRQTALVSGTPCRISAFKDPEVVARYPVLPAVLQGMEGAVATYPPLRDSEQVNILIYDEANAVCSGTKTAEQAVVDLQEKVSTFMRRRGYLR
jgi:ABC-type glycerol-3-phosphate transport system substrate-binding protein